MVYPQKYIQWFNKNIYNGLTKIYKMVHQQKLSFILYDLFNYINIILYVKFGG